MIVAGKKLLACHRYTLHLGLMGKIEVSKGISYRDLDEECKSIYLLLHCMRKTLEVKC